MVERNIISSLKFKKNLVTFSVMEKVKDSYVEIFSKTSETSKISSFLDESLKIVEQKIGGKLTNVVVVLDENEKIKHKIEQKTKSLFIPEGIITSKDIENAISLIKMENKIPGQKIINVQPNKFIVYDKNAKSYVQAPLGKKGNRLEITSYITRIDENVFHYIEQIVESKNLILSQILLSCQENCQRFLSSRILEKKVVLVNLLENKVSVSINENFCVTKNFFIYNFGFNNLVSFISKYFNSSKEQVIKLINLYGDLNQTKEEQVFYDNLNNKTFTNINVINIIKSFLQKIIILIKKFLDQENCLNLPLIITGKAKQIENVELFFQKQFENENIFLHKALNFIEKKHKNFAPLGIYNFFKSMDKIYSRQYNTIIETSPERISQVLKLKRQKKWYSRFLEVVGGKNV